MTRTIAEILAALAAIVAIALAVLASAGPTFASPCGDGQHPSRMEWPGTTMRPEPFVIDVQPGEDGATLSVWVYNGETSIMNQPRTETLGCAGHVVGVLIDATNHIDGLRPDTVTVIPPAGFIAIPPEVVIEEGEAATIRIYPGVVS